MRAFLTNKKPYWKRNFSFSRGKLVNNECIVAKINVSYINVVENYQK